MIKEVTVYIDKTDYEDHVPDDYHGIHVYFSRKSLEEDNKCVKACGIVKCKIIFEEIVDPGIQHNRRGKTDG